MVHVDLDKCTGCKTCEIVCQVEAIKVVQKKATVSDKCVNCAACVKVCPTNALTKGESRSSDAIVCGACPIACEIKPGFTGACLRYIHNGKELIRNIPLVFYHEVTDIVPKEYPAAISKPLTTAIGAGTTSPDSRPAPFIVQSKVDGVDVVTCVTECPFTVNSLKVKIDTDVPIGEEGTDVTYMKRRIGMVTTEEYGATMLALGGLHATSGKNGVFAVKAVTDIANRKRVPLAVKGGAKLEIQVSQPPVINGIVPGKMRVGCGSATAGLFSTYFRKAADEAIVLDHQITSLFSEHAAGRDVNAPPSGIVLKYRKSTPGRYFGEKGEGLGGTNIVHPVDVIDFEKSRIRPGMTLLITETTGERFAFYRFENGTFREIEPTPEVLETINEISSSCEPSMVSAMFISGAGGSARAGITRRPLKLNEALRAKKARMSVGGAPVFIMPGGGITFVVDVEQVKSPFFYWVPTPAVVAPIEYTISLEDYIAIGGHAHAIRPLDEVIEEMKQGKVQRPQQA
jgi:6-hydroxynicotinate reductase